MIDNKRRASGDQVKRLSAQDIYDLTRETLAAYFPLQREGCRYDEQDIWDVLIAAAAERETVETMSEVLADGPSANTVRNAIKGVLPDDEQVAEMEGRVNAMLVSHLPKGLLAKALPSAIDLVLIPYHGQHEAEDEMVRRGRAKSGTTHFHAYATLCVIKKNKRYTLALVRRSDSALDVLQRLLQRLQDLQMGIKRLLLDREFDNNAVIGYLKQQSFPAIIALVIRGTHGGTHALVKGRRQSYVTTYTRRSAKYPTETFTVYVACKSAATGARASAALPPSSLATCACRPSKSTTSTAIASASKPATGS